MSTSVDSTASAAKYWEKSSSDTFAESIRNARDIGQVRLNYSRLSVMTTISEKETQDWFSFSVTSPGDLRLTAMNLSEESKSEDEVDTNEVLQDLSGETEEFDKDSLMEKFKAENLLVEVYTYKNNRQVLLASNDEKNSSAYAAFEELISGDYATEKGTYYLHVTTKDGKPASEDVLYALQLQMGDTYEHDYLTKENAVDYVNTPQNEIAMQEAMADMNYSSDYIDGKVLEAQGACNILAAGYTNMANFIGPSKDSAYIFSLLV